MLGIENIKKLLKAGLNFGLSASEAFEDKKISFFEAIGLVPEIFALIGVAKSWPEIQAELKELSEEEKVELSDFVNAEFDIPNDKVELFIEHALMQVLSLSTLIAEFKSLNDEPKDGPEE